MKYNPDKTTLKNKKNIMKAIRENIKIKKME